MPSRSKSKFRWMVVCGALAVLSIGLYTARGGEETTETKVGEPKEVGVYEATVTVRSKVKCRRYEGKVLFCTVNPLKAVRDALDVKLLLGYARISIEGDAYRVDPQTGGEVKFYPRGDGYRKDYSGEQELELTVIYVN
jgi:hypothetical protein